MSEINSQSTLNEPVAPKIIRADRTLRTVTFVGVAVVMVVGVVAIVRTESFLHDMNELARESQSEAAAKVGLVLKVITAGISLIPVVVGAYLLRVAVLTRRSGEFPPPGTRVLRDTTVTTGVASRRWAMFAFVVAAVLLLGGVLVPVLTWHLVGTLFNSSGGPGGVWLTHAAAGAFVLLKG
jgi:hypothetical protein